MDEIYNVCEFNGDASLPGQILWDKSYEKFSEASMAAFLLWALRASDFTGEGDEYHIVINADDEGMEPVTVFTTQGILSGDMMDAYLERIDG